MPTSTVQKRKPGNPNMRKGSPSINPKGKAAGREIINTQVTAALKYALDNAVPGGSDEYFLDIARRKPELFVGMLQRIMPTETAVNVTVNLADAMADAERRLLAYQEQNTIDITPAATPDLANALKDKE